MQQNIKTVSIIAMMILSAVLGFVAVSDGSSADSGSTGILTITGDSRISTGTTADYSVVFTDSIDFSSASYTATLKKDGTTVSSGISSGSSGSLTKDVATTVTIASQSDAGRYVVEVTVTEKATVDGDVITNTYTSSYNVDIVKPIVLKVTLVNNGSSDLYKANFVFFVDGVKIEGSETDATVAAGSTGTVSYSYLPPAGFSHGAHKYYIESTDGTAVSGIGADHAISFYYEQGNYDVYNYVLLALIAILVICLVWVLRKPVKNHGKPKARKN